MKKIFILLSTALLLVGFNVKAEGKKYGDVGAPYSFGLLQDAFLLGKGLGDNTKGDTIAGYNEKGRQNYLYMTKDASFPKTVTQYEATADVNARTIYLWANLVVDKDVTVSDATFPDIQISAKDENGDALHVYKYFRTVLTDKTDSLIRLDENTGDSVKLFAANIAMTIPTLYYGIDISADSRITLTWKVTYPEGHPFYGQDLTRTAVITKSADLVKNATLKILAVHNEKDKELTIEKDEFAENNQIEHFDPNTESYSVQLDTFTHHYVRFEPALSKSIVTAKLNGKELHGEDSILIGAGELNQIRVLKTGGLLELVVTAPNGITIKTYKITLVPPTMKDSDKKQLLGDRYTHAGRLFDSLYLTDGTAKYELFNDTIGVFEGFLYGTKGASKDSNTFVVSVPDIYASNLELGWHVIPDSAWVFQSKEYNFFVDKKTNASTKEVSWEVRLKQPKSGADKTKEGEWDWVKLDTVGSTGDAKGADSVVYHIKLKSNAAGIKSLVLYYDSLTATPVTLSPAFSPDVEEYGLASYVPSDVKKIYLVTTTTTGNRPGFSSEFKFNVDKPDNTYLYERVDEWMDGDVKTFAVTDTAADGVSVKKVVVELKKAYDLNLKSIKISGLTSELFSATETELKAKKDFDKALPPDFSLDNLLNLDIDGVKKSGKPAVGVFRSVKLTEEGYTFTFTVKSDREGDIKVYTVKLLFPKADATLDYLYTVPAGLTPEYSPEVTEYTLHAGTATSFRIITAPADDQATWSFSHTGDGTFALTQPVETFTVSVTSADKSVKKDYYITVTTEGLSLARISDSSVSVYSLNGKLNVTSPARERVYIHSVDGKLISHFDKKSGNIAVSVKIPTGIAIIKGSSGWVKKIYVRQ